MKRSKTEREPMKVMDAVVVLRELATRDADCRCGGKEISKEEVEALRIAADYLEQMP